MIYTIWKKIGDKLLRIKMTENGIVKKIMSIQEVKDIIKKWYKRKKDRKLKAIKKL